MSVEDDVRYGGRVERLEGRVRPVGHFAIR